MENVTLSKGMTQVCSKLGYNSLQAGQFCMYIYCLLIAFNINVFKASFQENHQSAKQFGSRSDSTCSVLA